MVFLCVVLKHHAGTNSNAWYRAARVLLAGRACTSASRATIGTHIAVSILRAIGPSSRCTERSAHEQIPREIGGRFAFHEPFRASVFRPGTCVVAVCGFSTSLWPPSVTPNTLSECLLRVPYSRRVAGHLPIPRPLSLVVGDQQNTHCRHNVPPDTHRLLGTRRRACEPPALVPIYRYVWRRTACNYSRSTHVPTQSAT